MLNPQEPQKIDPLDLFAFLGSFDEYPTDGGELAARARQRNVPETVVEFFESNTGSITDEEYIVRHAVLPDEKPTDHVLDLAGGEFQEPLGGNQELRIHEDIIGEAQPQ